MLESSRRQFSGKKKKSIEKSSPSMPDSSCCYGRASSATRSNTRTYVLAMIFPKTLKKALDASPSLRCEENPRSVKARVKKGRPFAEKQARTRASGRSGVGGVTRQVIYLEFRWLIDSRSLDRQSFRHQRYAKARCPRFFPRPPPRPCPSVAMLEYIDLFQPTDRLLPTLAPA